MGFAADFDAGQVTEHDIAAGLGPSKSLAVGRAVPANGSRDLAHDDKTVSRNGVGVAGNVAGRQGAEFDHAAGLSPAEGFLRNARTFGKPDDH